MCLCYLGQSKRMYILTGVETRWKVPGIISDSFQHVNNNNNKMQVTYLFIHPLGRPSMFLGGVHTPDLYSEAVV